ncbi:hypothetical protein FSP39_013313 [Pinctada imbricata]|uniref:Phytanoyl-CoA hydroxylase-interacting protein-like C-terminal domain-containing protein n=1 Tax=Pinctada imbricata TaxID=66713 RepID=A0AA89BZ36_PINIB|nr:hypothetical protein FSP39_013313 [Pinctada imbricata]
MTKVELNELFQKAVNHIRRSGDKSAILTHFYRTKPKRYFDAIRIKGCGVMRKYIKNLGGDPASSLNRNIRGLFFSAHLDASTLAPPPQSPYGDERLHIPVPLMMNIDTNLYFADFYCHISSHRVTLVITHRYSASDFFCQQRLIQLNVLCNPFLTLPLSGEYAEVTMGVKVEVFYTEDVDIGNLIWRFPSSVFFTRVKMNKDNNFNRAVLITSIGFSKKDGCTVCNLKKHLKSRK